jgi:hypothetical protein
MNAEMRDLAYRPWYKNGVELRPEKPPRLNTYYSLPRTMLYTPRGVAVRHVRRAELQLPRVKDIFHHAATRWDRSDKTSYRALLDLVHLLEPIGVQPEFGWLRELRHLNTLEIHVQASSGWKGYRACDDLAKNWTRVLKYVIAAVTAVCVKVMVSGFRCIREDVSCPLGCKAEVEKVLEDLVMGRWEARRQAAENLLPSPSPGGLGPSGSRCRVAYLILSAFRE